MSDEPSPFASGAAFVQIMAAQAARSGQVAEALPANKAALFGALAAGGVETLTITFEGCGDSGQIESVDARAGDGVVGLPDAAITITSPGWDGSGLDARTLPLAEAAEALVYDLLGEAHPGWEINEGSFGTFTFEVATGAIRLEFGLRATESFVDEW